MFCIKYKFRLPRTETDLMAKCDPHHTEVLFNRIWTEKLKQSN
uniref:Uncharacterized protein n=1 Tax=Anguilla anguilla TaxID=7936 RepID=A0A0E9QHF9_ANGAN